MKHFAKWDFYNNQWGNYANSIAYFDPTIIYKKVKKVEAFYNRYNRQVLHFMYMQRKEFMKEMDMLIIYMFILLMT
jgi:hypothetical protein